ncbi:MAG: alpha/beta fold hydrolase [Chloroflexota bacterium]|nr:alpha/beta fold hydrolase [Chloroflexota bacterium]
MHGRLAKQSGLKRTAAVALALTIAGPLIAGGAGAQDATPRAGASPAASPAAGTALVTVVHASPDAPAVDVFVDGERAITNLAFGAATEAVPLPAGSYDLAVAPAGAAIDDAVIEVDGAELAAGAAYEIAAVGTLDEIAAEVYEVDASPLPAGQARVRVVHASPDAPAIDLAVTDGEVLVGDLSFPDASDYLEVPAGTYDLEVRPAGDDEVVLALPNTALPPGAAVDVFAVGQLEDGSLSVLPVATPVETGLAGEGPPPPPELLAVPDPSVDYTGDGFARRAIATPTGRMVFYEKGEGTPLVFLHGIGGGASGWTWSKVAPAFADRYRVIVPDWVGWGASEHPSRFLQFDDYVAQLDALLEEIGEPAIVVAQSLSSGFAAEVAQDDPERFAALILLIPQGGNDFGESAFDPFFEQTIVPVARSEVNTRVYPLVFYNREFIRSFFETQGYFDPRAISDEVVDAFLWSALRPGAAYSALPFLSGDLRYDFAPYLEGLEVPTATVYGARETLAGRAIRERFAELRPDVPQVLIPRAAANFELELPAQTIRTLDGLIEDLAPDAT